MDLTRQPVTVSAELSSGVSRMKLTNKTCNILQTGKKKGSWLEVNMDLVGGKYPAEDFR